MTGEEGKTSARLPTASSCKMETSSPMFFFFFFFLREFSMFHFILFYFHSPMYFLKDVSTRLSRVSTSYFFFFFYFYFSLGYSLLCCVSFRHTQSDSVTHGYVSILFQILFPYMLLQSIKQDSPQFLISETFFLHSAL